MSYYRADADAIARLESHLETLGLPVVLFRKFMAILNAIEVQIEDEYADPEVADMLFESLAKLAKSIGSASGDAFANKITDCQKRIAKRLAVRATART